MGRRGGRGAALSPVLAETLAQVAAVLADAREQWWVIGSAAVVLHGGDTDTRDVDVLVLERDASALAERLALPNLAGDGDPLFRSRVLLRWTGPPLAVEIMAGLEVCGEGGWQAVTPRTRVSISGVFVPEAAELRAILEAFGREKDRVRAALLACVSEPTGGAPTLDLGIKPG